MGHGAGLARGGSPPRSRLDAVAALPELVGCPSGPTLLLLARGAAVYSAAALVYATKRPNPAAPAVFEYHEVFHALTIVAAGQAD